MTNQQKPEALTDLERRHAIRQGHEIAASDGYFEARPQIDSNDRRYAFRAGFERGWDRHAALVEAQQPAPSAAADPMDWPLPCDVTVGHGTMCKGVSLRTLVMRMKVLYEMATRNNADEVANRTPEENTALADAFRARIAAAPQPSPTPQADSVPAEAVQRIVHLRADRERRVYVAGPMTGLPEYNFPMFNATAARLRSEGWHVENPAEHGHVDGAGWSDYLRWDISRIATCGAIYLLPGWSKSKGATLEVHIAGVLGLQVLLADGAEAPQADSQPAPVEVADAMADSQYLAGVSAGWNAANADNPNEALRKLHESRAGYLKPLSAARAPSDSVTAPAYSIDADPQGIRARVADAITGALAFGAQGANPPPTGHWLVPFWETAREEASRNRPVSSDTLYLLRRLLSNQHTLTGSEFREELTKIVGEATQAADSVLEDAARYRWLRRWKGQEHEPPFTVQHEVDGTLWDGDLDAAIDAARKQGGAT